MAACKPLITYHQMFGQIFGSQNHTQKMAIIKPTVTCMPHNGFFLKQFWLDLSQTNASINLRYKQLGIG